MVMKFRFRGLGWFFCYFYRVGWFNLWFIYFLPIYWWQGTCVPYLLYFKWNNKLQSTMQAFWKIVIIFSSTYLCVYMKKQVISGIFWQIFCTVKRMWVFATMFGRLQWHTMHKILFSTHHRSIEPLWTDT